MFATLLAAGLETQSHSGFVQPVEPVGDALARSTVAMTYMAVFAFVLGAAIGSFLNVCIYRMPRDLSVNNPRRSFCPHCGYQIPWFNNLPLVSWLALRGKCAKCGEPISFRYFGVEFVTACLFLAIWWKVAPGSWPLAFPYWVFTSLLIVATFIDLEHFMIPDEITWGGAAVGFLFSIAIPTMHLGEGAYTRLESALWSGIGIVGGYGLLWVVVELGRIAFGRKRLLYSEPEPLSWFRRDKEADLVIGEDKMVWSDFFVRGSERLLMNCKWVEISGERFENASINWELDWLHLGERKWKLEELDEVKGEITEVTLPREAMGFGDVKFLACIGAFLGWKAVLFTIMAASIVGSAIGLSLILLRRREWSAKIPFGPYLAFGAMVWMFSGPELVAWYLSLTAPPGGE